MHDLVAITSLGANAARLDCVGAVTLTEVPDWALASVTARLGQEDACRVALATLLGVELPGPGGMVAGPEVSAFWTAPDQWMVEAPYEAHQDLARAVKEVMGDTASVTEQSDGWCRFDIEGEGLGAVFERLCNLDLATAAPGSASRTAIEHMGCFVLCRTAGGHISVIGPRSSAGSLHHALLTAMSSAL
ncbi:sarcosine oxidase subunit gamma [Roseovarius azorensis]|uniref:Sarcosine oxidase subunit gamma n=1 Tax=Roseovarius azorensis TaxID=1287727 RepID=A0A1H7FQH6_9RHOB|nr:sarcosine oxidase subunit gamma [Roseovarius azorensis]SEK28228.1 sarcosine oxidase subunit gamma [Roseovarius azorensis]